MQHFQIFMPNGPRQSQYIEFLSEPGYGGVAQVVVPKPLPDYL